MFGIPTKSKNLRLGVFIALVVAVGCGSPQYEEDNAAESQSLPPIIRVPETQPDDAVTPVDAEGVDSVTSKTEPDFRLTPEELYDEFTTDEEAAQRKYENKIVEVNGVVSKVGLFGKEPFFRLATHIPHP